MNHVYTYYKDGSKKCLRCGIWVGRKIPVLPIDSCSPAK